MANVLLYMMNSIRRQKVPKYWKLYLQDPFHSVVNLRLSKVLGALVFMVRISIISLL